MYFVTPVTPRNSGSQAVVAYAGERADEAGNGLNPLSVYVVADKTDPVSMAVIEAQMTSFVNGNAPDLLASGAGQDHPLRPEHVARIRRRNRRHQDYIDVSSDGSTPSLLVLTMTTAQITRCIQQLATELNQRAQRWH